MGEMHEQSDIQLLRNYTERGCQSSFRELVTRHTNFVYSTALRQVKSPDMACDVAQNVFVDLARKARSIANTSADQISLVGWLHRATRYLALNHVRDTSRRYANEKQAMEQLVTNSESQTDWDQIGPVLDEALDSLKDDDREALLLRYFKNCDFSAVGLALGVSDDAAQKRVSRAVERLREFFVKRGITISVSGLVVVISANAIQAAPIGLAVTISSAAMFAGSTALTSTSLASIKIITMTTLQKTIIIATLATAIGTGFYEAHQASRLREVNQSLQQQNAPLVDRIEQLQRERGIATNRVALLAAQLAGIKNDENDLLRLRAEVARLRGESQELAKLKAETSTTETGLDTNVKLLRQRLDHTPEAQIPELKFLDRHAWLFAADRKLDTDEDYRTAFSDLRGRAKSAFIGMVEIALRKYFAANNGQFPMDISELKTYFDNASDAELLDRYQIVPAKTIPHPFPRPTQRTQGTGSSRQKSRKTELYWRWANWRVQL